MYSQDDSDYPSPLPITVKPNNKKGRCGRKQVSCSECKRAKMKCELVFPCSSCIKKGCADICPQGALVPSKSNIHLKLKKEDLQDTVRRLQTRSRALETALRDVYGHVSTSPHPLLRDGVMFSGNSQPALAPQNAGEDDVVSDLLDAFGSLAIGDKGQAIYHAVSSSSEHTLRSMMPDSSTTVDSQSFTKSMESHAFPEIVISLIKSFPYGVAKCDNDARQMLLSLLPSQKQASIISSSYFRSGSHPSIDESEFKASVLHQVYSELGTSKQAKIHFHKVALLYIVLAGGTFLANVLDEGDSEYRTQQSVAADQYYRLSQAALAVETIGDRSNSWTIATLLAMMDYLLIADWGGSNMRWSFLGLIVRVAYMIGLHLDPSHWGLDDSESQRRRDVFWELFTWEYWISISYGRPPTINPSFTDCRFGRDMEPGIDEDGEIELGYRAYMHRMAAFYLSPLSNFMFDPNPPSYSALLKLEEDFRKFKCPSQLQCPTSGLGEPVDGVEWARTAFRAFQQYSACVYFKECTLLYVHRKFFVRALRANSQDPLQTSYGPSVISSIKSAKILLRTLRSLLGKHLAKASRVAFFWTSALSSIFMLGSLVYVCPGSSIAMDAFQAFEDGVDMFINFRSKEDKTGMLTTEILRSLRNEVRSLLIDNDNGRGLTSKSRRAEAVIRMLEGHPGLIKRNSQEPEPSGPSHTTPYVPSLGSSLKPADIFQMQEYGANHNSDSGYGATYDASYDALHGNPALPFSMYDTRGKQKADMLARIPTITSEIRWRSEAGAAYDTCGSIQDPFTFPPGPESLSGLGTSSISGDSEYPLPGGISTSTDTPWDLFLSGFSDHEGKSSQSTSQAQFK